VWIFQDGHLQGLLGFHSEGALDATQPIFLFAVGFGLATDYGRVSCFHGSRRRMTRAPRTRKPSRSGSSARGRIVTAAAVLFAVAIGAFATSQIVFIKELGIGAALAVLIDASIIRALLVPSLMELLGPWKLVGAQAATAVVRADRAAGHRSARDGILVAGTDEFVCPAPVRGEGTTMERSVLDIEQRPPGAPARDDVIEARALTRTFEGDIEAVPRN